MSRDGGGEHGRVGPRGEGGDPEEQPEPPTAHRIGHGLARSWTLVPGRSLGVNLSRRLNTPCVCARA